jgi:hypothetical protein
MPRVFGLLICTAFALGFYLLLVGRESAGAGPQALAGAPFLYSGWAVGLFMGLLLAWLAGLEWHNLPERIAVWGKLQRHRLGWVLLGGLCTGILLLL